MLKNKLAHRMTGKPTLEYDGKIVIFEFHINEHEHILLINTYNVFTDSGKVNPNNISKKTYYERK